MKRKNKSKLCFLLSAVKFPFGFLLSAFMLLGISSCSNPTSNPKGSLSGVVFLDGQAEHSDITIALYDLAYLDTTITRINNEYPHIGVIITQHTEFDHRFQTPFAVYQTETDGSFLLEDVPTGKYNLVAIKDGWGFKYLLEVEIVEGENVLTPRSPLSNKEGKSKEYLRKIHTNRGEMKENLLAEQGLRQKEKEKKIRDQKSATQNPEPNTQHLIPPQANTNQFQSIPTNTQNPKPNTSFNLFPLSLNPLENRTSDITLYPETTLSGTITDNWLFRADHHYIIEENTEFAPWTFLEIQPAAVVRIDPGKNLTIHGSFKAQGEENNMFLVTSNDGFGEELTKYDSIQYYYQMELTSIALVEDDLIVWGKWDWGNHNFIINNIDNELNISSLISRNTNKCFLVSDNEQEVIIKNTLSQNSSDICVQLIYLQNCVFKDNIVINGNYGIELKHNYFGEVRNNFITNNYYGLCVASSAPLITHNDFTDNYIDIRFVGRNVAFNNTIKIFSNFLNSARTIWHRNYTGSYGSLPPVEIIDNNFFCNEYFISYRSLGLEEAIYVDNNFLVGCYSVSDVKELCFDQLHEDLYNDMININTIKTNPHYGVGVQ